MIYQSSISLKKLRYASMESMADGSPRFQNLMKILAGIINISHQDSSIVLLAKLGSSPTHVKKVLISVLSIVLIGILCGFENYKKAAQICRNLQRIWNLKNNKRKSAEIWFASANPQKLQHLHLGNFYLKIKLF